MPPGIVQRLNYAAQPTAKNLMVTKPKRKRERVKQFAKLISW
jgi:hypothetical protein